MVVEGTWMPCAPGGLAVSKTVRPVHKKNLKIQATTASYKNILEDAYYLSNQAEA